MAEVPRYVLDASVASRWYLRDEQFIPQSQQVLNDFRLGKIRLLSPEIIRHEVSSAILKATRHPDRLFRPTLNEGRAALELFLSWPLEFLQQEALCLAAYDLAGSFGCSYYDSLYLAAAEMTNSQFLFADNKLRATLRGRFPRALWIDEYH